MAVIVIQHKRYAKDEELRRMVEKIHFMYHLLC